jgi:diaminohydroxyphosphoribosylaminopyrimidine deaminase / 5-amino-6-(5-phosphoribosylamino)uracil reductase
MHTYTDDDRRFMQTALDLAKAVKGHTHPNPAAGAVLVKNGRIIGKGATAAWGGPHAEKAALADAGERSRNATLYVTLEPCCHFGKTPPCTDAILAAGCSRVLIAVKDPNPLVTGKGIAQLRRHGIDVATGLLRNEASVLNEDFFWAVTRRRTFITLKLALTLDGRIADSRGGSKWITSPALRSIVHRLRSEHAGIAVGKGTLNADNPKLTVRTGRKNDPARIIFTSGASLSRDSYFYNHAGDCRSIVVVRKVTRQRITVSEKTGLEYWYTGSEDPVRSMIAFTEMAYTQHLTSIFVEGGATVASVLLEGGLVNRLYLFYGNRLFGNGKSGILFSNGLPVENAITLKKRESFIVGDEFYLTGIPDNIR